MSQKMCRHLVTQMQKYLCINFSETITSNCSTFNETKCFCFTDQICANNGLDSFNISTSGTCLPRCPIHTDIEGSNDSNSINTVVIDAQSSLVCLTNTNS